MGERVLAQVLGEDAIAWRRASAREVSSGTRAAFEAAVLDCEVVAVLPGTATLLLHATLPPGRESTIAKALPFAVEDRLAEDPADLVFAQVRPGGGPERAVAVMHRDLLERALEALRTAGATVVAAIPEPLLLPATEAGWTVLVRDTVAVVRTGATSGFAVELDTLADVLACADVTQPRAVTLYAPAGAPPLPDFGVGTTIERIAVGHPMEALTDGPDVRTAPSFVARESRYTALRSARFAAAAAAVLLLAGAVYTGVQWRAAGELAAERDALRAAQERHYREAFPAAGRIVDVVLQARQRLEARQRRTRDGLDFLDAVYLAGLHTRTGDRAIEFNSVSFRDGVLNVQVNSRSAGEVEAYRNALLAENLTAELLSAQSSAHGVVGRLRIARAGP